jgi:hypothetical protein
MTLIPERRAVPRWQYDIVLALAVLHKLADPREGVRFCCAVARSLIVVRLPIKSTGRFRANICAQRLRFARRDAEARVSTRTKRGGPRGEWVHYYRKC